MRSGAGGQIREARWRWLGLGVAGTLSSVGAAHAQLLQLLCLQAHCERRAHSRHRTQQALNAKQAPRRTSVGPRAPSSGAEHARTHPARLCTKLVQTLTGGSLQAVCRRPSRPGGASRSWSPPPSSGASAKVRQLAAGGTSPAVAASRRSHSPSLPVALRRRQPAMEPAGRHEVFQGADQPHQRPR